MTASTASACTTAKQETISRGYIPAFTVQEKKRRGQDRNTKDAK